MADNSKAHARARLALRAERAFGLDSVRISEESVQAEAKITSMKTEASPEFSTVPRATDLFAAPPVTISLPVKSTSEKVSLLKMMNENEVRDCPKCRLCETRTNTVFGEGDPDSKIMFIGEGPGENEDLQGRPFVGRAGELLNKWITAMGLRREQVFIANIVKCRPPGNREPAPDEVATCTPYLVRQIEIIHPRVIVTLGRPSMQYMLQTKNSMGKMRGTWQDWRGVKLMPTYHPAYVLRSYTYETRKAVWDDLQMVMKEVGLPLPARKGKE
ncbi:MAG TPA: uracil-DNA glycosylase [Tepidisphaeraceae bacterium]|nr:uracil-DNA glycosylase [Tepidisphaeraceae bacterium]